MSTQTNLFMQVERTAKLARRLLSGSAGEADPADNGSRSFQIRRIVDWGIDPSLPDACLPLVQALIQIRHSRIEGTEDPRADSDRDAGEPERHGPDPSGRRRTTV